MVNNNSCPKYKYLAFKVQAERNKMDAMYAWTYTVTGIGQFEDINILGYYDEKKTAPVVLMSNKTIYEYDWTTVPSRIRSGIFKNYIDQFKDEKHIIIISDAVSFEHGCINAISGGLETGGFILSHAFEGYTLQFINPAVYSTVETENLLSNPSSDDEKKKKREEKLDAEWKKRYGKIPESERPTIAFEPEIKEIENKKRFHLKLSDLAAVAMVIMMIGIIAASIIGSHLIERFIHRIPDPVPSVQVTKTVTKNPYTHAQTMALAIDSMSVFEDGSKEPIDVKALTDSLYTADLTHRADSLARMAIIHDSLISTLPKEKKVQVELMAVIEDGVTTRKVQTSVILDTIKESDMRNLTRTITDMATNMAKDRQTEIDTSRTYYKMSDLNKDNFISMK